VFPKLLCKGTVKLAEDLIETGIKNHAFGPINLRKYVPEDRLSFGKVRLLEVDSLVELE